MKEEGGDTGRIGAAEEGYIGIFVEILNWIDGKDFRDHYMIVAAEFLAKATGESFQFFLKKLKSARKKHNDKMISKCSFEETWTKPFIDKMLAKYPLGGNERGPRSKK